MLENPAKCTLNVDTDFTWGDNLLDTQFAPAKGAIFSVELLMGDNGADYTTNLTQYRVR